MKRIIKTINLSNSKKFKTRFKLVHGSEEKSFFKTPLLILVKRFCTKLMTATLILLLKIEFNNFIFGFKV